MKLIDLNDDDRARIKMISFVVMTILSAVIPLLLDFDFWDNCKSLGCITSFPINNKLGIILSVFWIVAIILSGILELKDKKKIGNFNKKIKEKKEEATLLKEKIELITSELSNAKGDLSRATLVFNKYGGIVIQKYLRNILLLGDKNVVRITVYAKGKESNTLIGMCRHSMNDDYREIDKSKIKSKGLIIKSLIQGNHDGFAINLIMKSKRNGRSGKNAYIEECKQKYGMTKKEVEAMKMKSIDLIAFRIDNATHEGKGVILIESTEEDILDYGKINETIENLSSEIQYMVDIYGAYINPVLSRNNGL